MDISKCGEVFPNIEEIVTAYSNTRHYYNDAILKLFSRNRKKNLFTYGMSLGCF